MGASLPPAQASTWGPCSPHPLCPTLVPAAGIALPYSAQ